PAVGLHGAIRPAARPRGRPEGDRGHHAGHDRALGRRGLRGGAAGPGRPAAAGGVGPGGRRTSGRSTCGGAGMTDSRPLMDRPDGDLPPTTAAEAVPPRSRRPAWQTFAVYAVLAFITLSVVAEIADAPALTGSGTWGAAL